MIVSWVVTSWVRRPTMSLQVAETMTDSDGGNDGCGVGGGETGHGDTEGGEGKGAQGGGGRGGVLGGWLIIREAYSLNTLLIPQQSSSCSKKDKMSDSRSAGANVNVQSSVLLSIFSCVP